MTLVRGATTEVNVYSQKKSEWINDPMQTAYAYKEVWTLNASIGQQQPQKIFAICRFCSAGDQGRSPIVPTDAQSNCS